jgi:hypothetical protein
MCLLLFVLRRMDIYHMYVTFAFYPHCFKIDVFSLSILFKIFVP